MKRLIATVCCFIVLGLIGGCGTPKAETPEFYDAESVSAGVLVHGYCGGGWIKNTNDFPVRVKRVWISKGESTQSIDVLAPGEVHSLFVSHRHGFYVTTLDGVEIAWIRPNPNGPKSS